MRTLKRTLCLVLALVMCLGFFGIASAASFKDDAKIQYKEAVGVMSGIGAINGMGDGTFNPGGAVTRAQAAKMVAYAVLGETVAKALPTGNSSFKDVDANYAWAIPSIEYLASKGIINGRDSKTFDPQGSVTAYEIAKMLLCAAGYGKNGEYTGNSWALNVAIDAQRLGVFTGTKATDLNKAATREECALYCFNGLTKVELVAYSKDTASYVPADKNTTTGDNTIATSVHKLASADVDAVDNGGVAGKMWFVDKNADGTYDKATETSIGVYNGDSVAATYKVGTTIADIAKAQGIKNNTTSYTVELYRNDVANGSFTATGAELYTMKGTATVAGVAAANQVVPGGVTVDAVLPVGATNKLRLLYNVHYLAQLTDVKLDTTNDDIDNRALVVNVIGYGASPSFIETLTLTATDYVGFNTIFTMVKDQTSTTLAAKPMMVDVVPYGDSRTTTASLQTAGEATIKSVAMPTTVDGKVSTKGTGVITVGDKTYSQHFFFTAAGMATGLTYVDTYTFVLDSTGAVAYAKPVAGATSSDYAYVAKAEYKSSSSLSGSTNYAKAQVIFTDGTTAVVDMALTNKGTTTAPVYYVDAPDNDATVDNMKLSDATTTADTTIGTWFRYVKNTDGTYSFIAYDNTKAGIAASPTLNKGTTQAIAGKNTASTTVVTAYDANLAKTTWTGYAANDTALTGNVLYTFSGTTITAIYAVGQTVNTTSKDYAYAIEATGNVNAYGAEWLFAVNGTQVKYYIDIDTTDASTITATTPVADSVYNLTSATNNTYTIGTAVTPVASGKLVSFVDGNTLFIATESDGSVPVTYTFVATHGVFNVDSAKATTVGGADTLEVGDTVTIYGSAASATALVFITTAK